jgi:8-oxo-dGTP diphosphatase
MITWERWKPLFRRIHKYPHPAVTVDCVVFGLDEGDLKVLLIQRDLEPFSGAWALPGGFIKLEESLEASARRELEEETGVSELYLEQLFTFGEPARDPRERVITVAYFAIVNLYEHKVRPDTDARNAAWFSVDELPELAFGLRVPPGEIHPDPSPAPLRDHPLRGGR